LSPKLRARRRSQTGLSLSYTICEEIRRWRRRRCVSVATLPPAGKAGVLLIFDVHLVVGGAPTEEAA
jgi:hypothetical protein